MSIRNELLEKILVATGEFDTLSRSVIAIAERSSEGEVKLLGKKTE